VSCGHRATTSKASVVAPSLELVQVVNLPSVDAPDGMNVTVRGLTPAGFEMRHQIQLSAGRMFTPGQREVVVGKAVAKRYPGLRLRGRVTFARGEWEVVGVLDGGQSALNSEIFGDLHQIASDYNRPDALSSVLIRAENPMAAQALINDITSDVKLNLKLASHCVRNLVLHRKDILEIAIEPLAPENGFVRRRHERNVDPHAIA